MTTPHSIPHDRLLDARLEWLETDGLGGFASGTPGLLRTRRYHALLSAATTPPAGRYVLVNAVEAWVEGAGGREALGSHLYAPGVVHPDGRTRLVAFEHEPAPRWVFALADGTRVEQRLFVPRGLPAVVLTWRLAEPAGARRPLRLSVRPLVSGRDPHALQRENPAFRFEAEREPGLVRWRPYPGLPAIAARSNGAWRAEPLWYRSFLYTEERERGLDCVEDLAAPGVFEWDLARGEACLVLAAEAAGLPELPGGAHGGADGGADAAALAAELWERERAARARFATHGTRAQARVEGLLRAADQYLVRRGDGLSLIAGYPWFGDWGRDTFLALRGLCLATGRLDEARDILLAWTGSVSAGMLPNRFPDRGEEPEYNSVDASLWFVIAAGEYLAAAERAGRPAADDARDALERAVAAILDGYAAGTRYGIRADHDGLLAAGEPGWQLTWMDARADGREVTPRIGKPVEVQALWLNALRTGAALAPRHKGQAGRWSELFERGLAAFRARFWNERDGYLFDVVDCDHVPGRVDATLRPNQVLAAGGLPLRLVDGERARAVVDALERELWTPLGLRTLAPRDPRYVARYTGGPGARDAAYHQGTVWPWLVGPFVDAWLAVRGGTAQARAEARRRFVEPLLAHLGEAGLGHVSEIADAEPPHAPRGCPFQAWSLGELVRALELVSGAEDDRPARARRTRRTQAGR